MTINAAVFVVGTLANKNEKKTVLENRSQFFYTLSYPFLYSFLSSFLIYLYVTE